MITNEDKEILIRLLQEKINLLSKELAKTTDSGIFNSLYKRFAKLTSIQTDLEMEMEKSD